MDRDTTIALTVMCVAAVVAVVMSGDSTPPTEPIVAQTEGDLEDQTSESKLYSSYGLTSETSALGNNNIVEELWAYPKSGSLAPKPINDTIVSPYLIPVSSVTLRGDVLPGQDKNRETIVPLRAIHNK